MFTGARFVGLAPLLVPSYVLALWLRQLRIGEGVIYSLPFLEIFADHFSDVFEARFRQGANLPELNN